MKTFLLYFFAFLVTLWFLTHLVISSLRFAKTSRVETGDGLWRLIEILAISALWSWIICL